MMILGTGIVITQADGVITTSQSKMRANAEAAAIAQAIREDIESMVKTGGFLAIVAPQGAGSEQFGTGTPAALIFTSMGSFTTRSGVKDASNNPVTSNAAVVCYTIRQDTSSGSGNEQSVFCRDTGLLAINPSGNPWSPTTDVMNLNPAQLANLSRSDLDGSVINALAGGYSQVASSPVDLVQVQNIWPVMAANCVRFSVEWLYDGDNNWHGFNYTGDPAVLQYNPADGTYSSRTIGAAASDTLDPVEGSRGGAYIALWSHHYNLPTSPKWPKAIKIRFTLRRQVKGETNADHEYEVICHLNQ